MNCFSVEIMDERSWKQFPYFVPIIQLIWPPMAVFACDCDCVRLCIKFPKKNDR